MEYMSEDRKRLMKQSNQVNYVLLELNKIKQDLGSPKTFKKADVMSDKIFKIANKFLNNASNLLMGSKFLKMNELDLRWQRYIVYNLYLGYKYRHVNLYSDMLCVDADLGIAINNAKGDIHKYLHIVQGSALIRTDNIIINFKGACLEIKHRLHPNSIKITQQYKNKYKEIDGANKLFKNYIKKETNQKKKNDTIPHKKDLKEDKKEVNSILHLLDKAKNEVKMGHFTKTGDIVVNINNFGINFVANDDGLQANTKCWFCTAMDLRDLYQITYNVVVTLTPGLHKKLLGVDVTDNLHFAEYEAHHNNHKLVHNFEMSILEEIHYVKEDFDNMALEIRYHSHPNAYKKQFTKVQKEYSQLSHSSRIQEDYLHNQKRKGPFIIREIAGNIKDKKGIGANFVLPRFDESPLKFKHDFFNDNIQQFTAEDLAKVLKDDKRDKGDD